jgi:hypothetical protein
VLGPHDARLRQFMRQHPEVVLSNSHMFPEWFEHKVWDEPDHNRYRCHPA